MNGDAPKSIVHPTDLTPAGQDAFAHALRIAVATKGLLHILHVGGEGEDGDDWERLPHVRETLSRWGLISPTATRADVAEKLGVKFIKALVEADSAAAGVSAYVARHACDLMVLMSRSRLEFERWLEGSVSEETVRATHAPALILRDRQQGFVNRETGAVSLNTVLMPVTAEVSPLRAFRHVADFAHAMNPAADVMLLHVGKDLPLFDGLLPHIELRQGPVVETILAYAQEIGADMIAMPTQSDRTLRAALIGTTAEQVVHGATCPVYAIPAA